MKTAISLPDETFDRATRRAAALGMSRSEFFARAAQRYLDQLDAASITRQIDAALDQIAGSDDSAAVAVAAAHRRLGASGQDW